ncbi:zinc finger CCCH domain-containing protein 39 isoform X2 [Spinacia oleracea]|uniref:Zinc finger CCCH domain-containing protein 39 isoform X2 n=1 Tax=Spinacia oleracea TaxID=3562 RepID=A0A9R0JIC4_SPIOL|nr:zinc finger CCCH domain-containing protein 39-like isoform X2 [Spinacia oleracea]
MARNLRNTNMKPLNHASYMRLQIPCKAYWDVDDKLRCLADLSLAEQKVYVQGGSKKEGPIELEVYNQGMFKSELCNKWQETKTCPYGDHCQFAHGIDELRPVIRHPRCKTEVCRMVLSGALICTELIRVHITDQFYALICTVRDTDQFYALICTVRDNFF